MFEPISNQPLPANGQPALPPSPSSSVFGPGLRSSRPIDQTWYSAILRRVDFASSVLGPSGENLPHFLRRCRLPDEAAEARTFSKACDKASSAVAQITCPNQKYGALKLLLPDLYRAAGLSLGHLPDQGTQNYYALARLLDRIDQIDRVRDSVESTPLRKFHTKALSEWLKVFDRSQATVLPEVTVLHTAVQRVEQYADQVLNPEGDSEEIFYLKGLTRVVTQPADSGPLFGQAIVEQFHDKRRSVLGNDLNLSQHELQLLDYSLRILGRVATLKLEQFYEQTLSKFDQAAFEPAELLNLFLDLHKKALENYSACLSRFEAEQDVYLNALLDSSTWADNELLSLSEKLLLRKMKGIREPSTLDETFQKPAHSSGYLATKVHDVATVAKNLSLTSSDTLIDLGCGLAYTAALFSLFTPARVIGVEHSPKLAEYARQLAANNNLDRLEIVCADARKADLSKGTVFYLYLPFTGPILGEVMNRLREVAESHPITIVAHMVLEFHCPLEIPINDWLTKTKSDGEVHYWASK